MEKAHKSAMAMSAWSFCRGTTVLYLHIFHIVVIFVNALHTNYTAMGENMSCL